MESITQAMNYQNISVASYNVLLHFRGNILFCRGNLGVAICKNCKDGVLFSLISSLCTLIDCSVVAVGVLGMLTGGKSREVASLFTLNITLTSYPFSPIIRYFKDFFFTVLTLM